MMIAASSIAKNTPERALPEDLPTICNAEEFSRYNAGLWRTPADGRTYPKWPLSFYTFDNYPEAYNFDMRAQGRPDAFWPTYEREQNKRTGESLMASTGIPLTDVTRSDWTKYRRKPADFTLPDDIGNDAFPQCGAMIEEIASGILYQARARQARYQRDLKHEAWRMKWENEKREEELAKRNAERGLTKKIFGKKETLPPIAPKEVKKPTHVDEWQQVEDTCEKWLHIADRLGPAGTPDTATRKTFKDWLGKLNTQTIKAADNRDVPLLQTHQILLAAMRRVVQRCAADSALCAVMPPQYFTDLSDHHGLIVSNPNYPNSEWAGPYTFERHQMLGYFPSSQDTIRTDSKDISLLDLFSNYGMDFMFCDVGQAHIFISPEDLRAGRFDKAYAQTQGG